jgi:glycosyltransferase involved in cell wall biosynthesis
VTNLPAERKPTVWMNVTTSVNWTRAAVGIVRVEKELCRELSLLYSKDDFGLCIFQDGEFVPYTKSMPMPERLEARPPLWPDTSRRFPRSSTFDPTFGAPPQAPQSHKIRPSTAPTALSSKRPGRQILYGDIILSVGLDWDYPYINDFQTLKDTMGIKIVSCCYDLIPILFPQYCVENVSQNFKDYFSKISWSSSLMLCISQKSRDDYRDFVRKVGAPEVDMVVIPLGDNVPDDLSTKAETGNDDKELSPEVTKAAEGPFILFVGTIERRKNHEVLYRAYHLLGRAGHADRLPKLVFVGMPGWGTADLLKDIELDPLTSNLIVQLHHLNDQELSYLYQKAYFCAFPSLYEGWGLPVGEALACGKAVIASAEGSIPEVGGTLVTYLDPWNPRAWADEILALVNEPERVKAMEAAVREKYQVRTWRGTANVVKSALDRLREPTKVSVTLYPGYDLHTMAGTPCGETMRSTGTSGSLTHGPYRTLPPGTYDIEITMDKLEGDSGEIFFALRSGTAAKQHAELRVKFDRQEHFGVVVRMEKIRLDEPANHYEVYSETSSNLLISINKIDIRELVS